MATTAKRASSCLVCDLAICNTAVTVHHKIRISHCFLSVGMSSCFTLQIHLHRIKIRGLMHEHMIPRNAYLLMLCTCKHKLWAWTLVWLIACWASMKTTSAFSEFSWGFTVAILSSLFVLLPEKIYHLLCTLKLLLFNVKITRPSLFTITIWLPLPWAACTLNRQKFQSTHDNL